MWATKVCLVHERVRKSALSDMKWSCQWKRGKFQPRALRSPFKRKETQREQTQNFSCLIKWLIMIYIWSQYKHHLLHPSVCQNACMLTCAIVFVHHDIQRYRSLSALPPCFCAFQNRWTVISALSLVFTQHYSSVFLFKITLTSLKSKFSCCNSSY